MNHPTFPRPVRAIALAGLLALGSAGAIAQALAPAMTEKPQYGGTLNIGMIYVTLAPLSWDPADWTWKYNQDTGLATETLFAADQEVALDEGISKLMEAEVVRTRKGSDSQPSTLNSRPLPPGFVSQNLAAIATTGTSAVCAAAASTTVAAVTAGTSRTTAATVGASPVGVGEAGTAVTTVTTGAVGTRGAVGTDRAGACGATGTESAPGM